MGCDIGSEGGGESENDDMNLKQSDESDVACVLIASSYPPWGKGVLHIFLVFFHVFFKCF